MLMEPELERLFEVVSGYFGLLAEPTRLKILNAICDGERSVSEIVEQVGSSQTNVSRHLNMMYGRGVLKRRREGATVYYSVSDPNLDHAVPHGLRAYRRSAGRAPGHYAEL